MLKLVLLGDLSDLETSGRTWRSCDRLQMIECIMGRCSPAVVLVLIRQGRMVVRVCDCDQMDVQATASEVTAEFSCDWTQRWILFILRDFFSLALLLHKILMSFNLTSNDRKGQKSNCKSGSVNGRMGRFRWAQLLQKRENKWKMNEIWHHDGHFTNVLLYFCNVRNVMAE